ncbi:hypothetical protein ACIPPN_29080 [Streptomyces diastaticus]|uniref:hypothetical protein n=1 Tax=Streptomyces diastaticus TaxID=1956 RepID=UPI00381A0350
MTSGVIRPLTIAHLTRSLEARAGQPMEALRCYESLAALWIRCCDTATPGARVLRETTLRAARRLAAGETALITPEFYRIPDRLTSALTGKVCRVWAGETPYGRLCRRIASCPG